MSAWSTEIPLLGAGGEPVDLKRTLLSHGFVELPPMRLDEDVPALELTLAVSGKARTIGIRPGKRGHARVDVAGRAPSARTAEELVARARHVLALDEDLSDFYELVAEDPELSWVAAVGAGRLIRSPSVFEDVVKTICTQRGTDPGSRRRPLFGPSEPLLLRRQLHGERQHVQRSAHAPRVAAFLLAVAESVEERHECTPMTETPSVAAGMQMIQRSRLADSPRDERAALPRLGRVVERLVNVVFPAADAGEHSHCSCSATQSRVRYSQNASPA